MRIHMSPCSRVNGGFSLVELLIAICIIAVLAGLLFSVSGSIRQTQQVAQSSTNLRTIGNAINIYASTNDSRLPVWHDYLLGQYWWEQLLPLMDGNTKVYHSPGHREFDDSTRD